MDADEGARENAPRLTQFTLLLSPVPRSTYRDAFTLKRLVYKYKLDDENECNRDDLP